MTKKTKSVFTEEERAEIKFQNEHALKGVPGAEHENEEVVPHNLDKFRAICRGDYGHNMKGRLGYTLNRIASNAFRTALRDEMKTEEKDINLESCLSEEDIALMFGFETAPEYTLDQCCHWMMLTFLFTHDVAQFTEANERGEKSKPYHWMEEQIKTPLTLAFSDMQYRIKSAVDTQVVQYVKLGFTDIAGEATELFKKKETALAQLALKEKVEVIKGHCDMHSYKYGYESDQLIDGIAEMIATLGLDVPAICEDIAQKYKDGRLTKVKAGERIGEVDERILEFIPLNIHNVGTQHAARCNERVSDDTLAHIAHGAEFSYPIVDQTGTGVNAEAVERSLAIRAKRNFKRIPKGSAAAN